MFCLPVSTHTTESLSQGPMADLEADVRRMMLPNTALNLKESRRNVLKDFVQVTAAAGVKAGWAGSSTHGL